MKRYFEIDLFVLIFCDLVSEIEFFLTFGTTSTQRHTLGDEEMGIMDFVHIQDILESKIRFHDSENDI